MSDKTAKILAYIVVGILYIASAIILLSILSIGIEGIIGLSQGFNIIDLTQVSIVLAIFIWIFKSS